MHVWIPVVLVGLGSYALRAAPLFSARCRDLSPVAIARLERAGFASLLALAVAAARRQSIGVPGDEALAAGVALGLGAVLALRGRKMHEVALAGLGAHLAVSAVLAQI
jgi:hypothetical protein